MFEEIRDHIIERGLKDCRRLLKGGKGPEGFYDGAVDGFDACRGIPNSATLGVRIHELEVELMEKRLDSAMWIDSVMWGNATPPDGKSLREWWYWRGYLMQLEFVWDRLSLLEAVTHDSETGPGSACSSMLSGRAVIDVLDLTQRILPPMQEDVEEPNDKEAMLCAGRWSIPE